MVAFNPDVPQGQDNMPNWTRFGSPASSFEGDKSSGIAISTAAQAIESGTNILDTTAKDVIKKDVRGTVEPIREDFTNQLITARDQATGTDIIPPSSTSVPPPTAIQSGIQKVQAIQLASENGKVNDTYYDMRLKSAVTDLRAKYPGYIDYIDSQVSSITGVNPANALVQNLMQDINRLQTNKRTATDKAVDDAMKSGYPDANIMVQKLQSQGESYLPQFREWYAKQTVFDSSIKRQNAVREANKGTKEDISTSRVEDFTNEAGSKLSTAFDKVTTIPGVQTPQQVLSVMADAVANPDKYNDAQMRQLAVAVGIQKTQWESEMRARAREIGKDSSGRSFSYYSDVGDSKIDNVISSMGKSFDTVTDALTKGGVNGVGVAYAQAIHTKAILDGGKDSLVSNKDIGEYAVNMASTKELFGDNWQQLIIQQGLKNDIDTKMRAFLTNKQTQARLGVDNNGKPVTLAQQMDEAKVLEDQGKITSAMRGRYTDNLFNIVNDIKNKEAPINAKEKVVKYLFSPEGQGILGKIKTDYTDPNTGKFIPGKYSVFQRLTSDDVVNEVKKMGPEYQQMYKGYLEREAGAELFQKEFLNLNHFTGHDNLHFKYNDGGSGGVPNIELIDNKGALASPVGRDSRTYNQRPPADNYIFQVQKIIDRVNSGLAGMSRVEKGFGGDASEYVLDFMVNKARVDMGTNWEGLPGKLVDAIAASRAPKKRIEDTFDNLGNK